MKFLSPVWIDRPRASDRRLRPTCQTRRGCGAGALTTTRGRGQWRPGGTVTAKAEASSFPSKDSFRIDIHRPIFPIKRQLVTHGATVRRCRLARSFAPPPLPVRPSPMPPSPSRDAREAAGGVGTAARQTRWVRCRRLFRLDEGLVEPRVWRAWRAVPQKKIDRLR